MPNPPDVNLPPEPPPRPQNWMPLSSPDTPLPVDPNPILKRRPPRLPDPPPGAKRGPGPRKPS